MEQLAKDLRSIYTAANSPAAWTAFEQLPADSHRQEHERHINALPAGGGSQRGNQSGANLNLT